MDKIETPNINVPNFQEKIMEHIKKITNSIKCTIEQKEIILLESEKILNKLISKAKIDDIDISTRANPLSHAAAIAYAVS